MPSKKGIAQPLFLNLDSSYEKMPPTDAPFIKDLTWDINKNQNIQRGTGNPSEEGQNLLVLTPSRSNIKMPNTIKPDGYNKNVGTFESVVTSELYYFNFNSKGNHGIYVISGDTMVWQKVIVDPELAFTDNQDGFISEHRVRLRTIKNADGEIIEKILIWTDGNKWQGWINVMACISTNGFNVTQFPYWKLQPPHFDRRELLEYAVRPPMTCPKVEPITNTDADKGKVNMLIDTAFQFCVQDIYTDGRETTVSPYSVPFIIKTEDFLSNPDFITKKALMTISAGSCMVERKNIYYRLTKKEPGADPLSTWSQWYLYDTIYKYHSEGNTNAILGTQYWLRTNPWANYNYDYNLNTIQFVFDNTKLGQLVPQSLFSRIQTALPQLSRACSDLGDAVMMANNREGYDNFSDSLLDKLSASYISSSPDTCQIATRKVRLYAIATRGLNEGTYVSQPSYFNGTDTQFRFGGVDCDITAVTAKVDVADSKYFSLDFADKVAFRCYAKGTPYFADGVLYTYGKDNTLQKVDRVMDASLDVVKTYINSVYIAGGNFIWMFEFEIPAGSYNFSLGRHNISNNGDYRNVSTYVKGIANSRGKTLVSAPGVYSLKTNAVVSASKEQEIDCRYNDVDVWGNGSDLFYITTPYLENPNYRFIEGYIKESPDNMVGVELLPYSFWNNTIADAGVYTDKNGFYYGYFWGVGSNTKDTDFSIKFNCSYPFNFAIVTNGEGFGWRNNGNYFLSDQNSNGLIGFANYVLYDISIKSVDGTIGYSNIGISIKDGETVYTDSNGLATLRIHNGTSGLRVSDIIINAGGNFTIASSDCSPIPPYNYNESLVPCQNISVRKYPTTLTVLVKVQGSVQESVKSNSSKIVGIVGADLAGRVTFLNKIEQVNIPSFNQRNSISATILQWVLNGALNLNGSSGTKDIAWLGFYVSQSYNYSKYLQWVGDKVEFVDSAGNVTATPSNASLVRITISSLLQANINSNFSLFANYEFAKGDKIRILDDGTGQLFDTATYGDVIDVDIQGTNYNTAAVNANLIAPLTNTVLSSNSSALSATVLYVKYDSRFDKLQNDTGFWIELYTPSQNNDKLPYYEVESFYPVINGEIAQYQGGGVYAPLYTYPITAKLNFWDTYLIRRSINIPTIGNKFFNHPFESQNISDTWGANAISGGRQNTINTDAKQLWYEDETIRSDNYISNGIRNGLGTFRSENKKTFKGYKRGGITGISCQYSVILFLCENDWFVTDYNYNYIYANAQGVQVANLDNNMGEPHQKVGNNFGCAYEDTATVVIHDSFIAWYDRKNAGYILCNYSQAKDITRISDDKTGMIQSYFQAKSAFITKWNQMHTNKDLFDVICGIDMSNNNLFVTFRPRRNNTNNDWSYTNERRNVDIKHQETLVYSLTTERWLRFAGFTPEAYGKLRGNSSGRQLFSFSAGDAYYHSGESNGFCNFYGRQMQPCFIISMNMEESVTKTLKSIVENTNGASFYVDNVYGSDLNSFSYIPHNYLKEKEDNAFATFLRNMNTYPPVAPALLFRTMLFDGKRMWGNYFVCRFILDWNKLNQYFEVNTIEYDFYDSSESTGK